MVAVGKSSIVLRFVSNKFNEVSASTIGAAYLSKTMTVNGLNYKFQIWDTAGAEKVRVNARILKLC